MNQFFSSSFLQMIYGVFALSWLPYIVMRLSNEPWIYSLFYRANGMFENITVLLYLVATALSFYYLLKAGGRSRWLWGGWFFSLFMLGEETRWGLIYLSENVSAYNFTSVQDAIQWVMSVYSPPKTLIIIFAVIVLMAVLRFRHILSDVYDRRKNSAFYSLGSIFVVFLGMALFIEFMLQPGDKVLTVLEETLEMNASFVWLLIVLSFKDVRQA